MKVLRASFDAILIFLLALGCSMHAPSNQERMSAGAKECLSPADKELFRNVKVIRIVLEQSGRKKDIARLPFYDYAEKILECAGFQVVKEGAKNYDATLHIKAKAIPKRHHYSDGRRHWTSATVRGTITLSVSDRTLKRDFSGKVWPPQSIPAGSPSTRRSYAPLRGAFDRGFVSDLPRLLAEVVDISTLSACLKHEDWRVRKSTAVALREINPVQAMIFALKDDSWRVREAAARSLGELRDLHDIESPFPPELLSCLPSKDLRAVEPLISALEDSVPFVGVAAARSLGKLRDPRAVEPLISALKVDFPPLGAAAAEALGELKDLRAVEPLISALRGSFPVVRCAAARALEKITQKDFGRDYAKWQSWWQDNKNASQ